MKKSWWWVDILWLAVATTLLALGLIPPMVWGWIVVPVLTAWLAKRGDGGSGLLAICFGLATLAQRYK